VGSGILRVDDQCRWEVEGNELISGVDADCNVRVFIKRLRCLEPNIPLAVGSKFVRRKDNFLGNIPFTWVSPVDLLRAIPVVCGDQEVSRLCRRVYEQGFMQERERVVIRKEMKTMRLSMSLWNFLHCKDVRNIIRKESKRVS